MKPGAGGVETEAGPEETLIGRWSCQQAKSAQLLVRKDYLLAVVTLLEATQAGQARKPLEFCGREAEQGCCLALTNAILPVPVQTRCYSP